MAMSMSEKTVMETGGAAAMVTVAIASLSDVLMTLHWSTPGLTTFPTMKSMMTAMASWMIRPSVIVQR
jgi:hypothetical protein